MADTSDIAKLLADLESLRATGDILADELSVLNHTTYLSSRCRDALADWDGLSFPLRQKLRQLLIGEAA